MLGVALAYLINQYPQPSQSFIRREIRAVEALGVPVVRFTVRRYGGELVDPADQEEQAKTISILQQGGLRLLKDAISAAFASPGGFWAALRTTWRHGRTGGRGRLIQLIYLAEAAALKRLLAEAKVEHVHAHFGTNSTEVALLCRLLGGPGYSFTTHGPEEFDAPTALHLGEKVRHSRFAVCISSYGRSQMWRWADFADWEKVQVVHCGVDEAFLEDTAPPPVPENRDFVCVGRLAEQKGQLVLMQAARALKEAGEAFRVHLLGDGPLRGEIERYIARHGLLDQVILHGFTSNAEVRRRIIESRATVLPSFAEGLPVALMESLALGRPCVTTYVAGIPELVQPYGTPGANGWLTPAGDVAALVEAMQQVLRTSTEALTQMGQAGARRVRERHDVHREAAKLVGLFGERRRSGADKPGEAAEAPQEGSGGEFHARAT